LIVAVSIAPTPFFIEGSAGGRFAVRYSPEAPRQAVLFVPPFAEEMNKSRHAVAAASRAIAARGVSVLAIDLFGCGDSDGAFVDARWELWLDDIDSAVAWLQRETGLTPALWGLRLGATLATSWVASRNRSLPLILWQPVLSGATHLTQFLRLAGSATLMGGSADGRGTRELLADLAADQSVEVAGYTVGPALARGLQGAKLSLPDDFEAPVLCFEMGSERQTSISPALQAVIADWEGRNVPVRATLCRGAPFWQTQEIAGCGDLLPLTIDALASLQ
jgi:exosortase A-associated hydrolase 2